MFATMFDGLRAYYSGYESRRAHAGYSAAASLSFITSVALVSAITLFDYALDGNLDRTIKLAENKLVSLACGALVFYGHVLLAKRTGRYYSLDRTAPRRWKFYFALYSGGALILMIAAVSIAFISGRSV